MTLLYSGYDWDFDLLGRLNDACQEVGSKHLGLDTYPIRLEVITSEQMLDAYSSVGMPMLYKHWSFGKHFAASEQNYRKGRTGLAYEVVINSSPCIAYLMEENTATMQALVIAHAAQGHNHFFKNNYLFKQWTDAEGILDYLEFAAKYVARCEEKYGTKSVERVLDAAHALQSVSVFKYPRKHKFSFKDEEKRAIERHRYNEQTYNDLWSTLPKLGGNRTLVDTQYEKRKAIMDLPQENILYFVEKWSPRLFTWQRELIRIVRQVMQYFYPQGQTQVMNEGCATYVHYNIMTHLHQNGRITDGAFLEFLQSHTNVVFQPAFKQKFYGGINPYALGFDMCQDIERICTRPTPEDKEWFPDIAGNGQVMSTLRHIWANYRDESFISQFLSPHLMRKWRLFHVEDDRTKDHMVVGNIHNERGYRDMRSTLSRLYDPAWRSPDIQVLDVILSKDRRLVVVYKANNGRELSQANGIAVTQHLARLWGYTVELVEFNPSGGKTLVTMEPDKAIDYTD